ncbi:protein kinase [Nonomuraea sp. NPDC050556]|uniref:serine/threonine-protein kinase n=1 Tax=Nonomuraea sp. NPDC050556 TaxID=3364369 RepID=UPI0037B33E39
MLVGGRYRLLCTIGRGGMGTVWQAHDEVLGRDVAVKEVLPPPDQERSTFSARTFREARAAGRVAHPAVAAVYDVVEEHGHPWIVMQLVPSTTLGAMVRESGPLPQLRVAEIGLRVLEALGAAHAAGVLHRDVKPDNVLMADDGRVVLTDFGIATTDDDTMATGTGVLVGTPSYIAPERAAGRPAEPATDLWSLGVTLYFALEGHVPFHRDNPLATLHAILHADPAPMARAGQLAPVVHGLLAKDPAARMSPAEAQARLRAIVTDSAPEPTGPHPAPAPTSPIPRPPSGPPPGPRRGGRRALLVAAPVAVALLAGGAAWLTGRSSHQPQTPAVVPSVQSTATGDNQPAVRHSSTQPQPSTITTTPQRTSQPSPTPTRSHSPSATPTPTKKRQTATATADDDEAGQVEPDKGKKDKKAKRK